MIQYDTKNWLDSFWKIFLSLHWGSNYRILLRSLFFVLSYTTLITYLNINYFDIKFRIDPFFFSLLGLILSLFLVFRLNSSYQKWWEGRQLWGTLVNHSRSFSSYLSAVLSENDVTTRRRFAIEISNFAFALKGHLRSDMQFDNFDKLDDENLSVYRESVNIPHQVTSTLFKMVQELNMSGKLSDIDKLNIKREIQGFIDVMGSCERIRNTPIPFSHSSFFKSFIAIYILALPFGFVNAFLYFTIPSTLLISYALLGVEIISEEIEEPFGKDPNDLPLTFLAGIIRRDVYNILDVENTMPEIVEPVTGSNHFKMLH